MLVYSNVKLMCDFKKTTEAERYQNYIDNE